MQNEKKKVGIFSLTSDEGCSIMFTEFINNKLFDWMEKIEIFYFLSIKDHRLFDHLDIALIEGTVSTRADEKLLKEIREKSDALIALGNCAMTAMPSGQRNRFQGAQKEKVEEQMEKYNLLPKCLPLKDVVKVDAEIGGCPVDENIFMKKFEELIG